MRLSECVIRHSVYIDVSSEIMYDHRADSEQSCNYPTVEFQLMSTDTLCQIADWMRMEKGYKPIYTVEDYDDEFYNSQGWYDFYASVRKVNGDISVDPHIQFVVVDSGSPDDEETYHISLNEYECEYIFKQLNEEAQKYLGKTCEELLEESEIETEGTM